MGELRDRAKGRLTPASVDRDAAIHRALAAQSEALLAIAHDTSQWAKHMGQANEILGVGDATLNAGGVWSASYRAPYASVLILNGTSHDMKVASGPPGNEPGDGPAAFTVRAGSAVCAPLVGNGLSVYGHAGDALTYAVSAKPWPPFASAIVPGSGGGGGGAVTVDGGTLDVLTSITDPVTVQGTVFTEVATATATPANVAASLTSVTLAASNASRRGLTVFNETVTGTLRLVTDGAPASATHYTVALVPGAYWEMPAPPTAAAVTGIWTVADGAARVTEVA